ncbi:MAG: D-alanine--D-alanine ligase family protein [Angustibacter sp.]
MSTPTPQETSAPAGQVDPSAARIRVAVLYGGRSSEHGISCLTAAGVLRAIDQERYEVIPIGITPDGVWVLAAPPEATEGAGLPQVDQAGTAVTLSLAAKDGSLWTFPERSVGECLGKIDVVFPLLHGPFGEDGTVQGMLELGDIPYVGSGVFASAASMDKHYMKILLSGQGLSVGPYVVVTDENWRTAREDSLRRIEQLGFPVFVKPARAGSSYGISKVSASADLPAAIELAREHDRKLVIESGIVGRELECGVLETLDGGIQASEIGEVEVLTGHEFYDFSAKYQSGQDVALTTPAAIDDDVRERVQQLARTAFRTMGCEGLARVDVFYTNDGDIVINELNTMPGFTELSMFPRLWAESGLDYPELIDRLLQLALSRSAGLR